MGIEKFRFVSPGVQINEIDDSILPLPEQPIGPVVIGNTAKGPSMQPVVVSTISELEKVFGTPSNGVVGAVDVWRSGVPTSPTLATYAAKAFLTNAFPVTVVRLAGVSVNTSGGESGNPGWQVDKVTFLSVFSGSSATTASLGANIYHKSGYSIKIKDTSATWTDSGTGSLSAGEFDLQIISGSVTSSFVVSFDPAKNSYIRNQLNTNPSRYESEGFFLGESFENSLPTSTRVYITSSLGYGNYKSSAGATSATSPWVVGDFASGSIDPSTVVTPLFRFVGLNNGAYLSKDIKVSIENVKPSINTKISKYGTFDVVVRKLYESTNTPVLERFSDVTLDSNSDNYILRKIGDTVRYWDSSAERYVETGTFQNISAFIRVEMADGDISPYDLPRGFLIPGMPNNLAFGGGATIPVKHPNIELLTTCRKSVGKTTRFGLVSDIVENADLVDILVQKPFLASSNFESASLFHTRYVTLNTPASASHTYNYSNTTYDTSDKFASGELLGFDMPLYGGFDAKNICTREPFINNGNLKNKNEFVSPEYRAIKQAIDIVSQPEVIDMNLLAVPGLQNTDLTDYMLETCKRRGDSLAVIDLEGDYLYSYEAGRSDGKEERPSSVYTVVENLKSRKVDNSYGAAYFPAVFVPSEGIFMPASVAALGALGGTEGRQALWFAPAGFNRGGLNEFNSGIGVSRTALNLISSDRDSLYNVAINPIATFPNEGVVIFGQKTLQGFPSALDRINVRRLVNYLKKQISRFATKVLFEPNVEATWSSFRDQVDPFLLRVKNGFGIEDARVILDRTTTTADLIDRNMMYAKIYIKPTRAIEYIAIDFIVTNSGASFVEG